MVFVCWCLSLSGFTIVSRPSREKRAHTQSFQTPSTFRSNQTVSPQTVAFSLPLALSLQHSLHPLLSGRPETERKRTDRKKEKKSMLAVVARLSSRRGVCTQTQSALRAYHAKVVEHYEKPLNVGSFDKNDPNVGTGLVGAPACGDVMKLQIKVREWIGGMGGREKMEERRGRERKSQRVVVDVWRKGART